MPWSNSLPGSDFSSNLRHCVEPAVNKFWTGSEGHIFGDGKLQGLQTLGDSGMTHAQLVCCFRHRAIRICVQDDSQGGEEEATQAYAMVRRGADDEANAVSA